MLNKLWCCVLTCCLAIPVLANDEPATERPSLAELVRQLDAEDFAARQAATDALAERGQEALPALVEAATADSAEASARAFDILRKHLDAPSAELKVAAKASLQKLAAGEGAVARRASEALQPKPMPPMNAPVVRLPDRIVGGGAGGVRIVVAGGAGARRMTVKVADGVKEIEVVEGERHIKINEDPGKTLKLEVTTNKDGKEETQKYEAKNAAELKEKHLEAHRLYEQYSKDDVGLEGLRMAHRLVPPAIIRDPGQLTERLDKAQQQLDDAVTKLKSAAKDADNADLGHALEAIKVAEKQLEEVQAMFPKR